MSVQIVMDPTPRPLASYCDLWGKDRATLNAWAAKGWIPGAYKHGCGEWWVRPLDLCGISPEDIESNGEEIGDGRQDQGQVLRPMDRERRTRVRRGQG